MISGILPKLEYRFFEIYMFQIIKIIHITSKNIRFQGKIPKNISLRVISGILPKLEYHFFLNLYVPNYKEYLHDSKQYKVAR